MRIVQLIDSLEAGGAERMAVNYANSLADKIEFSGLITTRKEGQLLNQIKSNVSYLFLNKKNTIDLKAIFKLRFFVKQNRVTIVHAHGTSFFMAVLLKFVYPKVNIIWHEHYGGRIQESHFRNIVLVISSLLFSKVFAVNHQIENWVKKYLFTKEVFYIPNFVAKESNLNRLTYLKGNEGKRIVCLANLKEPKNHQLVLKVFKELQAHLPGWSLHFIGKDYMNDYSDNLKQFINKNQLEDCVFIYGSKDDIPFILSQCAIGILASTAEGFPLTLLEYGLAKLAVVSTHVGYCSQIIKSNLTGLLFDPRDKMQFLEQLQKMVANINLREECGVELKKLVANNYSEEIVMKSLLSQYEEMLKIH